MRQDPSLEERVELVLDEPRQLRAGGGLGVRDERGRVPLLERAGVACDERTAIAVGNSCSAPKMRAFACAVGTESDTIDVGNVSHSRRLRGDSHWRFPAIGSRMARLFQVTPERTFVGGVGRRGGSVRPFPTLRTCPWSMAPRTRRRARRVVRPGPGAGVCSPWPRLRERPAPSVQRPLAPRAK